MRNVLGTLAFGLCLPVLACRTPGEPQDDVDRRPIGAGRPGMDVDLDDDEPSERPDGNGPGVVGDDTGPDDDADGDGDVDTGDFADPECRATVGAEDPYYDRFEGTAADNTCVNDADCVASGCSGEICASDELISTCEALPYLPEGSCGCVEGICSWSVCDE